MAATEYVFDRPLTATEMRALALAATKSASDTLVTFYDIALSPAKLEDSDKPIDPKQFRIPQTQWAMICKWIGDASRESDAIAGVNSMLTWMNVGPSAREESRFLLDQDPSADEYVGG